MHHAFNALGVWAVFPQRRERSATDLYVEVGIIPVGSLTELLSGIIVLF